MMFYRTPGMLGRRLCSLLSESCFMKRQGRSTDPGNLRHLVPAFELHFSGFEGDAKVAFEQRGELIILLDDLEYLG